MEITMDFDTLRAYLLAKPEAVETFPFGPDTHVFKVKNKMFALIGWHNDSLMINLKCDPNEAIALCDIFSSITPGYHMDKKHWISVYFNQSTEQHVPEGEIKRLMDNSFMLVVNKLLKHDQTSILLHL